jgi:hypothetical protein
MIAVVIARPADGPSFELHSERGHGCPSFQTIYLEDQIDHSKRGYMKRCLAGLFHDITKLSVIS